MAQNPYVNKVIYGNQTLIDTTGDTAVASDVATGKTFHSATGEQLTGTKTAPTSITPSNASPVSLSSSGEYAPTESGYAIKSYNTITPSNSTPPSLASGSVYKASGNGYAIPSYYDIAPSNSNPATLVGGNNFHRVTTTGGGFAIESYNSITPSTSGQYFSSGMVKMSSSGYAYSSRPSGIKTGSTTITGESATKAISTGLTTVSGFIAWGVSTNSYGNSLQSSVRYLSSYGSNFYYVSYYANYGGAGYSPFVSTGLVRALGIKSVSGSTVTLIASKTTNWDDLSIDWYAW